MGDEASGTLEGKCLSTLRVVDLKMELERRGLSKSGSKKDLIKRLKQKLELEKLYEESSAVGENELKLQLDEATEQNEFVKQYLAEQQKLFASQREARRLIELEEKGELKTDDSDSDMRDSDAGSKEQESSTNADEDKTDKTADVNIPNMCDSTTLSEENEEAHPPKSDSEEEEIIPEKPIEEMVSEKSEQIIKVIPEEDREDAMSKNVIKPDSSSEPEMSEVPADLVTHVDKIPMNVDDMKEESELVIQDNSTEVDLEIPMKKMNNIREEGELVIHDNSTDVDLEIPIKTVNNVDDTREEGELLIQDNSNEDLEIPSEKINNSKKNNDVEMRDDEELTIQSNSTEADLDIPLEKISYRKMNIPYKRSESSEKSKRKSRWSSKNAVQKNVLKISSESLKNLIPEFHLTPSHAPEPEDSASKSPVLPLESEKGDQPPTKIAKKGHLKLDDEKVRFSCAAFSNALSSYQPKPRRKSSGDSSSVKTNKENDKVVAPDAEKEKPQIAKPAQTAKPTSCIIFIQNLVRPFTLTQLKEMLSQTGKIIEDGFWIDKIKSKCFVKYENEEQASNTIQALNGAKWPSSNPKILSVEFATEKEFDLHSKVYEFPKPPPELVAAQQEDERKSEELHRRRERRSRERERAKHVREWDKDKVVLESPERENIRPPHKEPDRSSEKKRERERRDSKKKPLEETPAKLLDDLFHKTKATPCIYWLPLTEDQAKKKEEERRQRRLDRERRNREEAAEHRAKRKSKSRSRSRTRRR